ncbi:MAG: ATP-dependent DNA helicase RecG [Patescibacteria group bacterium]|nr:ATP-dependent DNA helicase RecG [Patescibacteria group bacterium]
MFSFSDPIVQIPNIKKYHITRLQGLGIFTVEDLLYHFPSRYEDFTTKKKISSISSKETITTIGKLISIKSSRTWKRKMSITEAVIEDKTGSIKAVWFNNPLPVKFLTKGKYIQLSGKTKKDKKGVLHFQHPNFEIVSKNQLFEKETTSDQKGTNTGKLIAIYPETQGLNSYFLRRTIQKVFHQTKIIDFIPSDILKRESLLSLKKSLHGIHFPDTPETSQKARKRLSFEKMLLLQIKTLQAKKDWDKNTSNPISFDEKFIKSFVSSLPFQLTNAQKKAAWQMIKDLEKTKPMNRLLEGDVGSGKTVVAAIAALSATHANHQVALLAPTEVLATQHFNGISKLLEKFDVSCALLTGASCKIKKKICKKDHLKKKISENNVNLVIGTHAILQKDVFFKNLSLVIIDEQHRFGVNQRAHLQQQALQLEDGSKNAVPHLLTMTATPIPRSLSLALFGNLDLSIIDEYPKGRKNIITKTIPPQGRNQVYQFVKNEVSAEKQVFIIYPLVEESSKMNEIKAATQEYDKLRKEIFPKQSLGLIHGRMKSKEKEKVMEDFKNKNFDILISTSVIEVGVDIPNATIMIVEGAERFGLAQLHQFRGRVGRDKHQSYCFLFTSDNAPETTRRLNILSKTNDGFKISQEDMRLRGPGQFLGTLQSGNPDIAMESLSDIKTIESARTCAKQILAVDQTLTKLPLLKNKAERLHSHVHWE